MSTLRRYLLGLQVGRGLLFASRPASPVAEARVEVIPGVATGQHAVQPSFTSGAGLLFLPKQRERADVDGAAAEARVEVIPGAARGVARAVGAVAVRPIIARAPIATARAVAVGTVAAGPLKYWRASKWSPEYLAKLRDEDEAVLIAIS